ncbi:AAA family ATPase [Bacteroidota bacterium]
MANILLKYLEDRYKDDIKKEELKSPGPVITISRYFGCPANMCATDLVDLLTKMEGEKGNTWKVISKEILDQAAKELGLSKEKIEYVFNFKKRSAVDEVLEAVSSKYYKSERKIKNTIREVIRSIGEQGRVIIVGRAGVAILKDIPNSLHVKLIAPLDFRIKGVSKRHQISHNEAKKLILDMDKKRSQLRAEFAGQKMELVDYDLIFNCEKFDTKEIVSIVAKTAEIRGLI